MKKILFLLVGMAIAITTSAQRSLKVQVPEQFTNWLFTTDTAMAEVSEIFITEIAEEYTEVRFINHSGKHAIYLCNMYFDHVLDVHLNMQYVLYKLGYITRKQFCLYRKDYNKLRVRR
jgi:hypothetical protein